MTTTTNPQIQQYLDNAARFTEVVEAGGTWSGASPCEGWTARDVLDHVIDSQRSFLEQRGVELGARPTGDPAELWAAHLAGVRHVLADDELATAEYDGYFGRTSVADTLANFYGFDMLVHRWDLARGLGQDLLFTAAELAGIDAALDGFGDALYSDGVCKPALDVPADASHQDRVLARMGRRG
jgi:uncharacterized protein (TIGR03086 family)